MKRSIGLGIYINSQAMKYTSFSHSLLRRLPLFCFTCSFHLLFTDHSTLLSAGKKKAIKSQARVDCVRAWACACACSVCESDRKTDYWPF